MLSIIIASLISFFTVALIAPKMIKYLKNAGIVGTDVQKRDKPKVAEMGGPLVLAGFLTGMFAFVWVIVYFFQNSSEVLINIFAAISTITIIMIIGIMDDLGRWYPSGPKRRGLRQWQKPLLTLVAAIPLMAVMAGSSTMVIPLIGEVNLGILYPFLIVPLIVMGTSNAFNMLAGVNGLEAGLGVVLLSSLGVYTYSIGQIAAAILAFTMASALLGFLIYNWYPSKIFPGDSLVYMIGATVAAVTIIGNIEKFALFAFTPWFVELFLKARSKFKAESFGKLQPDGTLAAPYKKTYSVTHLVMKSGKFKEWQVTGIIIAIEIVLCISLLLFYAVYINQSIIL